MRAHETSRAGVRARTAATRSAPTRQPAPDTATYPPLSPSMIATYSLPAVSTPDRAEQLAAETADRIARMRRDGDSTWVERLTLRMAHEPPRTITDAERDCLIAASHGLRTAGIAALLGREPSTVQTHLTYARRRLRAKNTTHAVAIAIRMGLIA